MNRRVALKSLATTASVSLVGFSGCLGGGSGETSGKATADETTTPNQTTIPAESPAERIEWSSMGLQHVAFESLTEDDVRVTATVEIRNPTRYRVPVNIVTYRVLYDRDGEFVPFTRAAVSGCGAVDFGGGNRSYHEYQREAGPPCSDVPDRFVVEPNGTSEITAVAEPASTAESIAAGRLAGGSGDVFVRIDGAASLWNTSVEIDFETERVLRRPE